MYTLKAEYKNTIFQIGNLIFQDTYFSVAGYFSRNIVFSYCLLRTSRLHAKKIHISSKTSITVRQFYFYNKIEVFFAFLITTLWLNHKWLVPCLIFLGDYQLLLIVFMVIWASHLGTKLHHTSVVWSIYCNHIGANYSTLDWFPFTFSSSSPSSWGILWCRRRGCCICRQNT